MVGIESIPTSTHHCATHPKSEPQKSGLTVHAQILTHRLAKKRSNLSFQFPLELFRIKEAFRLRLSVQKGLVAGGQQLLVSSTGGQICYLDFIMVLHY